MPKHGLSHVPEFTIWQNMRRRCYVTSSNGYRWYGGKGIQVCDRWRSDFAAFYRDMGPRPSPSHSIDRVDPSGDYEPSNCRWATADEQAAHLSSVRLLTVNGKTHTLSEWARIVGLTPETLCKRLKRGWTPKMAVSIPLGKSIKREKKLSQSAVRRIRQLREQNGGRHRQGEAALLASRYGVSRHAIYMASYGRTHRGPNRDSSSRLTSSIP